MPQTTVELVSAEASKAGVQVWSHAGNLCTGETYEDTLKQTFAKGALRDDSAGLFNSSLDGKVRRAIDLGNGAELDEQALTSLVRVALALDVSGR